MVSLSGSFQVVSQFPLTRTLLKFLQNSTMKKSSLFSSSLQLLCVVTFHLRINTLGDTGQGNGDKKCGKLYWIREYNPSNEAINAKDYNRDCEKQMENVTGNWQTFQEVSDVMKETQSLKKRVKYLETSINSTQTTN